MLKDQVRTNSYKNAIMDNKHLFKDKVVLDVRARPLLQLAGSVWQRPGLVPASWVLNLLPPSSSL
jgi:hypothetical protein